MAERTIYPHVAPGDKFFRWHVISEAPHRTTDLGGLKRYWFCVCLCGRKKEVAESSLKAGISKSCGCLQAEITASRCHRHGDAGRNSKTREYETWRNIWSRCTDPLNTRYDDYGGRGIGVCDDWRRFECFLADMGRRPSRRHSIDRIDNDQDYSPNNCRWSTRIIQANHTRATRWVEYKGHKMSVADLARLINVPYDRLYMRIHSGWSVNDAVSLPSRPGQPPPT